MPAITTLQKPECQLLGITGEERAFVLRLKYWASHLVDKDHLDSLEREHICDQRTRVSFPTREEGLIMPAACP